MTETPTTAQIIPVQSIRDSMLILKDGGVRSILKISAINFELRSSDEQLALIQQFQNFLNSIDFKIQIIVQSRKYDIEEYISVVQAATDSIENNMLIVQANEYIRFVRELSDLANIMIKKFYIVIPIEVAKAQTTSGSFKEFKKLFTKKDKGASKKNAGPTEDEILSWQDQLVQRSGLVATGLRGMGLDVSVLDESALTKVFSELYNPTVPSKQK